MFCTLERDVLTKANVLPWHYRAVQYYLLDTEAVCKAMGSMKNRFAVLLTLHALAQDTCRACFLFTTHV